LAGRGLPQGADVRVRGGQIVSKEVPAATKELIDTLYAPDSAGFASTAADVELLTQRIEAAKAGERSEHLARLRTLVTGGVPEARLAAVKTLSQVKDIDSSPALIAALSDPDWGVVLAADEGLRFMGRKTTSAPLGERPDAKARAAAVEYWKTWYHALRPDAEFEN
jgi:HEAT repeat protein